MSRRAGYSFCHSFPATSNRVWDSYWRGDCFCWASGSLLRASFNLLTVKVSHCIMKLAIHTTGIIHYKRAYWVCRLSLQGNRPDYSHAVWVIANARQRVSLLLIGVHLLLTRAGGNSASEAYNSTCETKKNHCWPSNMINNLYKLKKHLSNSSCRPSNPPCKG